MLGDPSSSRPLVSCTGIATLDSIFTVRELPDRDGKWSAESLQEVGGGVAANGAVAVARLGGQARFVGSVGSDTRGFAVRDGLVAEGVSVDHVTQIRHRLTPTSAVVVDHDGNRMIVNHVDPDFFDVADLRWAAEVTGADAVLVDLRWIAGASATVTAAGEIGIPSVVDVDRPVALECPVLTQATHLVFSRDALTSMTDVDDPAEALLAMSAMVPGWLAVTVGDQGVLWLDDGQVQHLDPIPVDAVDTLGAGDTFHGAFALALAEGLSEAEALQFANAAAAFKCTKPGGRAGIPTRDELVTFQEQRSAAAAPSLVH